eukprot:3982859-Pyramimonas_sp.AAC.1
MAQLVLSEQQCESLRSDQIAAMRVYVSATATIAVVVEEDDLLAKAEVHANPTKISEALCTVLNT